MPPAELRVTAWSTDAAPCIASDFVRHPRGLGLLNGYGFHRQTAAPLRAAALCDAEMDMASLWNSFDGEWSALTIDDGRVRAASSALGTEHLYQTTTSSCIAIANRARLLWAFRRAIGESLDPDHEVLSQLVTLTYPFCHQRTAVRKIELVSPNVWLERKPSDFGVVEHSLRDDDGAPTTPIDWSIAKEHLVRAASWLKHADRPVLCALTGGKDSRLVLAALRGAGCIESIDRFYISAPAEHADAVVASSIATRFGLTFEQRGALSAPSLRQAFGRHVHTPKACSMVGI